MTALDHGEYVDADMKVRLETARLLLYQVTWLRQQGQSTAYSHL